MSRRNVMRLVALCGAACTVLIGVSHADPPPPREERGVLTPCNALVGPLFCFRVTDIEGVVGDNDRFRVEFEMVNWTSTDARRLVLTLNTARRPGEGLPPGAPHFSSAFIDEDGRPLTGNPHPPIGNLAIPNKGVGKLMTQTRIEFITEIPTTDCACTDVCLGCIRGILDPNLGFRDDKCCVCALMAMIPGSENQGGSPPLITVTDIETVDDGPNALDGFVVEIDDWDAGEEISFNWHMETHTGDAIGMIAPDGRKVGNDFGFGTLNMARIVAFAPPRPC